MAVLRKNKVSNYTVIDNNVFRDKEMSLKAKGLLCLMLSLPDEWDYTLAGLTALSSDGIDGTRSALNELECKGYFRRNIIKDAGRFSDVEYVISEVPMTDKPILEIPILEKPPQLNTNEIKEEKNKIYKDIVDAWNSICVSRPRVLKVGSDRRKKMKLRLAEHDYDTILLAFRKVEESDFLNSSAWCSFDWVFKNEQNIQKVLEGNYDNGTKMTKTEREMMDAYRRIEGSYEGTDVAY